MAEITFEQFRNKELDLAWEDLERGKVRVKFTGEAFYGTVSGGSSGIVRVPFHDVGGFGRMICNCADARKNRKCRHMAAVLYAICVGEYENAKGSYEELQERIDPFLPEEYQQYDFEPPFEETDDSVNPDKWSIEDLLRIEKAATSRSADGAPDGGTPAKGGGAADAPNGAPSNAALANGAPSNGAPNGAPAKGAPRFARNWKGNPFREPAKEEGIYYNLHRIMDPYEVSGETLAKARQLIANEKARLSDVRLVYLSAGNNDQCLRVDGICEGGYMNSTVSITMTAQRLVQIECRDFDCFRNLTNYDLQFTREKRGQSPCEHQLAVLLLLEEYIFENNPGDATNYSAESVLERFQNHYGRASRQEESAPDRARVVRLEPKLLRENEVYKLEFRIGKNKSYLLKNMQELLQVYDDREQMTLGKNNSLDFAGEDFDEASAAWLQLIRRNVQEATDMEEMLEKRLEMRYYSLPPELRLAPKRSITLLGGAMDDFFETALATGKPIDYEGKEVARSRFDRSSAKEKDKRRLIPRDERLHLQLTMEPLTDDEENFLGVTMTGEVPAFKFGIDYLYYISGNHLNRVPMAEAELLRPFLESRVKDGSVFMQFGRRSMAPLFHQILPEIEPLVSVEIVGEEMLEDYLPPEAEFNFWLDAYAEDVFCRPYVRYGEKTYNLVERMDTVTPSDPDRDLMREDTVLDRLFEYFDKYDPRQEAGFFLFKKNDDMLFRLLDTGLHVLMQLGEVHTTDRFDRLKLRRKPQISVGVTIENNLMNLSVLSDDMDLQELLDVLHSYREKRKYHRLKNGDFLRLDDSSLGELSDMLDTMHITAKEFVKGKMHLPSYRALYLDRMLEDAEGLYADRDHRFRQMVKEFKTVSDSDFEVPSCLQHVLRNYQKVGFQWMKTVDAYGFGGVLADEMGLGKTVQVIALLQSAKESAFEGKPGTPLGTAGTDAANVGLADTQERETTAAAANVGPADTAGAGAKMPCSLIVTPASLVYNWQEEFHKFAPEINVCVIAGGQKTRKKQLDEIRARLAAASATPGAVVPATPAASSAAPASPATPAVNPGAAAASPAAPDVLITSYDLLKRDIDQYDGMTFDYEIIDEAQFIKNHTTAAAKAVKVIQAAHRFALTGTPIENRLSELWSIFDYLMPGFLYGYETFRKEFETPIAKRDDEVARRQLKRMVSPFILRRLKQEVLTDLPEKLEEIRYVNFESRQRKVYDGQVVHMKQMLAAQSPDDFAKNKIQILAELTRIRQICCDPSLLLEDYKGASAKREAVIDLIESAAEAGHKMLVFSQFTSMLALLEQDLAKAGQPFYKITGETPKLKRTELVRAFNEDDTPVFLISLKAGGTGLNLTGADIVIHYDPWWNLAVQNQATDRAHRIGQEKTVTVYRMIAKGTIEEKIVDIQESKKELAEEILSGETGSLTRMSKEELLDLL